MVNLAVCASVLFACMVPLAVPAFADLGAEIDHEMIESGTSGRIDVTFTRDTQQQEYVNYAISITKDGRDVFGPTDTLYSADGMIGIVTRFDEAGTYMARIDITGVLHRPVSESFTFEIPVQEGSGGGSDALDEMRKNRIARSFMINEGYNDGLIHTKGLTTYMMVAGDKILEMRYTPEGSLFEKRYTCTDSQGDIISFAKKLVKNIKRGCPAEYDGYDRILETIHEMGIVKTFKEFYPDYEEELDGYGTMYEYDISAYDISLEIRYHGKRGVLEKALECQRDGPVETYHKNIAGMIKKCYDYMRHPVILDRHTYPVPFAGMKYHDLAAGSVAGDVTVRAWYDGTSDMAAEITRGHESVPVDVARNGDFATIIISHDAGSVTGCPGAGGCVLAGDAITISAGGSEDSAVFGLADGYITLDKSAYLRGSDMIITLHDPDLDLDAHTAESYSLDMLGWRTEIADISMGPLGGGDVFNPEPDMLVETGPHTGRFMVVAAVPPEIGGRVLDPGSLINIQYMDRGPAGASYVGESTAVRSVDAYTTNFGATLELDQKRYTWTDRVYIMVVAPDYNIDQDERDKIGADGSLRVNTARDSMNLEIYETGSDTGIFAGTITLAGFLYDADGNHMTGRDGNDAGYSGDLYSGNSDDLTLVFDMYGDESVSASAQIRWNTGEAEWLRDSYLPGDTGTVRIIDPDMNWSPDRMDSFAITVLSGQEEIRVTVQETNYSTGIFTGTVNLGGDFDVVMGDTITAVYEDRTLPDRTIGDSLEISASVLIGAPVHSK